MFDHFHFESLFSFFESKPDQILRYFSLLFIVAFHVEGFFFV